MHLHIRTSTGTDNGKALTAVTSAIVLSHGFLLMVSDASSAETWWNTRDYTYVGSSNTLVSNGGAYISLSGTTAAKVIDKVGWGTQPLNGYEGTALPDIATNDSVERKPAGGQGHATDTDVNSNDFNAQSATLTPRGTADAPQP